MKTQQLALFSKSRRGTSYESRRPGIASVDDGLGLAHGGGSLAGDQSALEIGDNSGTGHKPEIGDNTGIGIGADDAVKTPAA